MPRNALGECLQIYQPHPASAADMTKFHAEDYIEFLQNVTPDNKVWCWLMLLPYLPHHRCSLAHSSM